MVLPIGKIHDENRQNRVVWRNAMGAEYHYNGGFNRKAILAWLISGYIAVGSVWPNILVFGLDDFFANLGGGGGYAWIIGASLGALVHLAISRK